MKISGNIATAALCVAAAVTILSPRASADNYNHLTKVTFSGPVEIPGVHLKGWAVLPAGTYTFKLVDSESNRHIVQIFNKNGSKIYATIMAIPDMRLQPADKTIITFREMPGGQPPALRAWFYPGDKWGEEFVYPKARAKQIAQSTKLPVLYADTNTPNEVTKIEKPTQAEVTQMNQEPVGAYSASGEEEELSQAVTPPPPANMQTSNTATTPATSSSNAKLPTTASPLGFVMLGGLLSLFAALGIRLARQSAV